MTGPKGYNSTKPPYGRPLTLAMLEEFCEKVCNPPKNPPPAKIITYNDIERRVW